MISAALIGAGMVTTTIANALIDVPDVRLKWVYTRRSEAGEAFVAAHPALGVTATQSLDQIADDPEIALVIVATSPDARTEIIAKMAAAGKAILTEKPLERTLASASHIVEICEAADVPLGVFFQYRYRDEVAHLRAFLARMGTIHAVDVNVPWWRDQSYYDVSGRGTYARDGGGVLLTQAIHTLDLMLSLVGPVTDVIAMSATTGLHRMEAEDFVTAGLHFQNGAVGHIFATTASYPGRGESIRIHAEAGSAHLEAGSLRLSWSDGRTQTFGQTRQSGAGGNPMAFTHDWHRRVIRDFVEALHQDRAPSITGRSALGVHTLVDAIERSAKLGRRVTLES